MENIKETKELLIGINELSLLLTKHLKDGLQIGKDVSAIFAELISNEELKGKLEAAYQGVSAVQGEVKDLSLSEGLELVTVQFGYIDNFVSVLNEPKA